MLCLQHAWPAPGQRPAYGPSAGGWCLSSLVSSQPGGPNFTLTSLHAHPSAKSTVLMGLAVHSPDLSSVTDKVGNCILQVRAKLTNSYQAGQFIPTDKTHQPWPPPLEVTVTTGMHSTYELSAHHTLGSFQRNKRSLDTELTMTPLHISKPSRSDCTAAVTASVFAFPGCPG